MTLPELFDSVQGHTEAENEKIQWDLWRTRRQIYCTALINGVKNIREEEIFPLEIDDQIKKNRYKNMPEIKVTQNGG